MEALQQPSVVITANNTQTGRWAADSIPLDAPFLDVNKAEESVKLYLGALSNLLVVCSSTTD